MKTITIRFELQNVDDTEEFEASLDSWIADFMDPQLAGKLTYTITGRGK